MRPDEMGPAEFHPDDDRLHDLLHGLLAMEDEESVLQHIAGCDSCEARFRSRAAVRERLRGRLPELFGGAPATARRADVVRQRRWWSPLGLTTAAIAVAGIAVAVFMVKGPGSRVTAPGEDFYWLPDPGAAVLSRDSADAGEGKELRAGLQAYSRHDLSAACRLLSSAQASASGDDLRRVYLGSALSGERRYAEAAAVLDSVRSELLPDPWRDESRWTLAIALQKSGQTARGDSIVAALAAEDTPVGERARQYRDPPSTHRQ